MKYWTEELRTYKIGTERQLFFLLLFPPADQWENIKKAIKDTTGMLLIRKKRDGKNNKDLRGSILTRVQK